MTAHRESRLIGARCETVFDLVADVEQYPSFLSLWRGARIYRREGDVYFTEQEIGIGPICERFSTRTTLVRPEEINVTSDDALFRTFNIRWNFTPVPGGCRATVSLVWETRSRPLQNAIRLMLPSVARGMVEAFKKRADEALP